MHLSDFKASYVNDVLSKTALGVTSIGLLFLTPFTINNFLNNRWQLGFGSLMVVLVLAYNAWSIYRNRYSAMLMFAVFVPMVIFYLSLALYQQGIIGVLWSYPALISFYFILPERLAWLANTIMLAIVLPVVWQVIEPGLAARVTATLCTVSITSIIFMRVITTQQYKLTLQAITDPLTGLYNRSLLHTTLGKTVQQHHRTRTPMTLLAFDLDHFKSINDTYGHDAGDEVLIGVGRYLTKRLRRSDMAFRIGGEEFLILLYNTDTSAACHLAEELRAGIETMSLLPDRKVTASIGVATLESGEHWRHWMKRSDEFLYRAKSGGRNRVV